MNAGAHVRRYVRAETDAVGAFPAAVTVRRGDGPPAAGCHLVPLPVPAVERPADLPEFIGPRRIAGNQAALATALDRAAPARDRRTWLSGLIGVDVEAVAGHLRVTFPGTDPRAGRLIAVLTADPDLAEVWSLGPRNERPIVANLTDAVRLLSSSAPFLAAGLGTLLGEIVVAGRRGTGACSSSAAVGAVFISPRARWPVSKYVELLVHEFVHQALFLEECVHGMFDPDTDLDASDVRVVSAVRKVPRGFDKSFHAAWVAYVQRRLYHRLGIADPQPPGALDETLAGLRANRDALAGHGQTVLADLVAFDAAYPPAAGVTA